MSEKAQAKQQERFDRLRQTKFFTRCQNMDFKTRFSYLLNGTILDKTPEFDDEIYKYLIPDMKCVKIFKPGEAFGEIALLTNQRRYK